MINHQVFQKVGCIFGIERLAAAHAKDSLAIPLRFRLRNTHAFINSPALRALKIHGWAI